MSPPELEDPGQGVVPCASEYPIMEWEDAEHRLVLPQSLRTAIEVDDPILRWSRRKRALVLADHTFDEPIIRDINRYLEHWAYCGSERGTDDVWRVLFEVDARWYSLTLGRDATGSLNVVTVFGSSSASFLRNRLRGLERIVTQQR